LFAQRQVKIGKLESEIEVESNKEIVLNSKRTAACLGREESDGRSAKLVRHGNLSSEITELQNSLSSYDDVDPATLDELSTVNPLNINFFFFIFFIMKYVIFASSRYCNSKLIFIYGIFEIFRT
jgi:hypothetical protein